MVVDFCLFCVGYFRYSLLKGVLFVGFAVGGVRFLVELESKMIDDLLFFVFYRFCFLRRYRWSRLELTMFVLREVRARG